MIFQSTFAADPNRDVLTEEELKNSTPYDGLAAKPTPSWYSGLGTGFFRGMGSGALKSMSSAETAFSNTGMTRAGLQMYEAETGESLEDLGIQDIEQREQEIVNQIKNDAKERRRLAQREWGLENAGYGWAGELMYGLGETLPKAIGYSTLLGGLGAGFKAADITRGALGALAYGADVGIGEYNTLRDKGVDENTATWAGIATFGAGAIGLKIPATFGKSRLSSAVTGTLVNMGLSGAEVLSIGYILDNYDYTTLAKQYELDATNLLIAGVFGGVMGGALWRPEVKPKPKPKVTEEKKGYANTREKFEDQLGKTGLYSRDEVSTQGILGDTFDAMVEWAYGPNIKGVDVSPDVVLDEGSGGFNQTAWHGSPHIFDRFSTEHIGTGEGAQAHGWGLYFAADRSVAERYRTKVSRANILREIRDEYDPSQFDSYEDFIEALDSGAFSEKTTLLLNALRKDGWLGFDQPMAAVKVAFSKDLELYDPSPELVNVVRNFGRLFELDIPDSNVLLDEQLQVKDQPKDVKEAILKYMQDNPEQYIAPKSIDDLDSGKTGKQFYDEVVFNQRAKGSKTPAKDASILLNRYGIKGISYDGRVDGRSFVIFDDNAIKTLNFYQKSAPKGLPKFSAKDWLADIERAKNGEPKPLMIKVVDYLKTIGEEVPVEDRLSSGNWERKIENSSIGDIRITTRGSSELRGEAKNYPDNLRGLVAIEDVLRNGEFSGWQPNRKLDKKPFVKGYGTLSKNVIIDGEPLKVGVVLEKHSNGQIYYFLKTERSSLTRNFAQRSTTSQKANAFTGNDTLNIFVSQGEEVSPLGSYSPTLNKIKLTPNANLSTFSHEMGHVYLNMAVEMASSTSSNLEFRNDVNKLLSSYGVKDAQEFAGFDLDAQRKVHEKFASHFEIYLSTGKAPKTGLQKLFDKIGLWLLAVYRYVGGPERAISDRFEAEFGEALPKPSDEVLEFLDKLFSRLETEADAEIKAKVPKVDNDMNAAARTVVQKVYTDKKFTAVAEKITKGKRLTKKEREYAARMVQAGRMAEDQINEGETVSVSNNLTDMPANQRLIKDRSKTFVSGLSDNGVVLQNRDRSLPSSIAQMKSIAANPDYLRLGPSNSLSQGSPVIVNGDSIPTNQRGHTSLMVDANGKRYEVQYAVVEADDVLTSNDIDGSVNTEYPTSNAPKAVSGNGRITGLKEAYRLKTADKYRSEMTQEKMTGVDPNVIKEMENPILVRIMKNEDVTNDIGDVSNRSESAQLSDVEQAATDAQRLDLSAIRYGEDGDITRDSVVDFLQALPAEERARMIDASGNPTKSAFDRLDRAIMQAAYGNPNLTALLSTTEKTGISRLLSAARQIAPRVLGLEGEMDFRDAIVEVLGEIQNAKLSGAAVKLEDIAKQVNLTRSPEADAILQFLADNEANKGGIANIVNVFSELADFARANIENAAMGPDMFGEVATPTRKALMKKFSEITGVKINEEDFVKAIENVQKTVGEVKAKVDEVIDEVDSLISDEDLNSATNLLDQAQELEAKRSKAVEMLENPNKVSVENIALENPELAFDFVDESGNKTKMTAQEVLEANERELAGADVQESVVGRAVECVVNNNGV